MFDIHIPEITIEDWDAFVVFVAFITLCVVILAISNNWTKIVNFIDGKKFVYSSIAIVSILLFIPAIGQVFSIIINPEAAFPEDKRGYAVILAAVVGAPFVIWRTWVAQIQAETAIQGQITERITKAVEQLGAEKVIWKDGKQSSVPNLEVRLGAIYALERIAQDSKRDHISVMEILCAYVRSNAPASGAAKIEVDTESEGWRNQMFDTFWAFEMPIDIQAILNVIGRRKADHIKFELDEVNNPLKAKYNLDLGNTNLQNLYLYKANLNYARLNNSVVRGADLINVSMLGADLKGAKLQGSLLVGNNMQKAQLQEADMQGSGLVSAELQGADLKGAKMQGSFLIGVEMDASTSLTDTAFTAAAAKHVDFSMISTLRSEQVKSMFGDSTTKLPEGMEKPIWAEWEVDIGGFLKNWPPAEKKAGL